MNKDYLTAVSIAEKTLSDMHRIQAKAPYRGMEDSKGCNALENIISELESFVGEVKHYSRETREGYLKIDSNDRYRINDTELTCGYPMEIYKEEYKEWEAGRVEFSSNYDGYYFYNYDGSHVPLFEGMKARIRI